MLKARASRQDADCGKLLRVDLCFDCGSPSPRPVRGCSRPAKVIERSAAALSGVQHHGAELARIWHEYCGRP